MVGRSPYAIRSVGRPVVSLLLVMAGLAVAVVELALLPLVLLPMSPRWGWLLVPLVLLSTPLWSVIHESIHGSLFADRRWNDRAGRALAITWGAPFVLLKTGHLMHHRYSRTRRERTEIYDPATTGRGGVVVGYFVRLVGGLYLAEAASVAMLIAPAALWRWSARRLESPDSVTGLVFDRVGGRYLGQFRVDAAAVLVVHLAAAWAYDRRVWLLALAILGRALLVSLADNAYHYGTRLAAPLEALNLRVPRPVAAYMLAFNLHSVHHRHPGLPWYALRAAFLADEDRYHLGWSRAVLRQFRGPIPVTRADVRPLSQEQPVGAAR